MWTAFLNMEVAYGDAATVQKVFERACKNANSYTIHKTLAKIYQKFDKNAEATQILEAMIKKFRANQLEVWTLLAEHLMAQKDQKAARDLLPRALKSAPKAQQRQFSRIFFVFSFLSFFRYPTHFEIRSAGIQTRRRRTWPNPSRRTRHRAPEENGPLVSLRRCRPQASWHRAR